MNAIDVPCPSCEAVAGQPCSSARPAILRGRACYERVNAANPPRGYHVTDIKRGSFGEVSKIEEEFQEFMDATKQGVTVMQLVELSDMLGAIEGWLERYHPNVTLNQLCKMKDVTKRAFKNGHRKSR